MSFLVFSSLLPVLWKYKSPKGEIDEKHRAASQVQEVIFFFLIFHGFQLLLKSEVFRKITLKYFQKVMTVTDFRNED